MTRRRRRSRFPDALAAALLAAGALALPRLAAAQSCCVGTGLVTPARLRPFESQAVGMQMRARSVMGSFGPTGDYATSGAGRRELGFEEDLFGAVRLGRHFQVGVWAPFIQTSRAVPGTSGFGGGLGDIAASVRFDAVNAGEHGHWPGVAVLAALSLPTGQPLDETGQDDPLGTYGTGTGSYEGSLGLALEEIVGQGFVSASGWIAKRTGRAADGVEQSFPVQFSALVASGYSFGHDVTVGAFASLLQRGDARDPNGPIANSGLGLVTGGAALALPFWQTWRLQATAFTDVPLAGWGRNLSAGFGGTVAVIRFWI